MKRQIACRSFSQMCVAIQLDYLHTKHCDGLKPRESQIRTLDIQVRALWQQKPDHYFEPHWLRNTQNFTEKRSASFEIDLQNPLDAWQAAMANLAFNHPGDTWYNTQKSFYGMIIVENIQTPAAHAISVRKSHAQHYFIHDIHTDAEGPTAIDRCDCKEYRYPNTAEFEEGLTRLLGQYAQHGYVRLCTIALVKERPYGCLTTPLKNIFCCASLCKR